MSYFCISENVKKGTQKLYKNKIYLDSKTNKQSTGEEILEKNHSDIFQYKFGDCYWRNEKFKDTEPSFDISTYNYHVVPDPKCCDFDTIEGKLREKRQKIVDVLLDKKFDVLTRRGIGNESCCITKDLSILKWIVVRMGVWNYVLDLFTNYIFEGKINCIIGQIQFERTKKDTYINKNEDNKVDILYPIKENNQIQKRDTRIIVNTTYTIDSDVDEIAMAFIKFINDNI